MGIPENTAGNYLRKFRSLHLIEILKKAITKSCKIIKVAAYTDTVHFHSINNMGIYRFLLICILLF